MNTVAQVSRPIPASSGTVLRIAQLIRLADALEAAPVPRPLRRAAGWILRSRLDRGLFATAMALGCSVVGSEPMRSLTLARPLARGRGPLWVSGQPDAALLLIRLQVRSSGDGTEVSVAVGVGDVRRVRSVLALRALRAARPLVRWCLSTWLTSLENRIGALGASRVSRPGPATRS